MFRKNNRNLSVFLKYVTMWGLKKPKYLTFSMGFSTETIYEHKKTILGLSFSD